MSKIKVALRVRPLSPRELATGWPIVVGLEDNTAFITDIRVPERPKADSRPRYRNFNFDHAFWLSDESDEGSSQIDVYEEMGPSLEESILEGYNACLLAYGQSGTGKTHTMLGTKEDPGLIPRICQGLWDKFKIHCSRRRKTFRMEVSFMEIYREKVRDLLMPNTERTLKLREHPQFGPHVQGLTHVEINEGTSILDLLWEGERRRATGATVTNRHSSRSHAIWTLYLITTQKSGDGSELVTRNQVHLVDLAGSEKADLITTKHRLAEGKDINRSLVSLGNVISSLAERAQYIPYRDSALTWLLKDSLGGNSRTAIIITASPASSCHAQTLNSLRFAQRARLVENKPKINVTKSVGGKKKASSALTGMTPFDLKRDISKLANIIRSAQIVNVRANLVYLLKPPHIAAVMIITWNCAEQQWKIRNGGIFHSLTPTNGWTRLITAIENWNHLQNPALENRRTQGTSTSLETIMADGTKETTDGEVQVDMKISRGSYPISPTKTVAGTEVFIPTSQSLKCLTWRQQEVKHLAPATPDSDSDSSDISISSSPAIRRLKYMVATKFPITSNLSAEGRITEKIHGTIEKLREPIQIYPVEILPEFENSPVICEKCPTLVNPQPINSPPDKFVGFLCDENQNFNKLKRSIHCRPQESQFSFNIPQVSEFCNQRRHPTLAVESADEDEEDLEVWFDDNQIKIPGLPVYRPVQSENVLVHAISQDDTGIDPGSSCNASFASSSSYQSLQLTMENPTPVKVVQNSVFNFAEVEDRLENFDGLCPHSVATLSCLDHSFPNETYEQLQRRRPTSCPTKFPLNATTSSRFQNFFVRELSELENIGKQIKLMKAKQERYSKLGPYLDKIEQLTYQDHYEPDKELDTEIEQCCGWNVGVEFEKVQQELSAIQKLLQSGQAAKPSSETSLSNPESSSISNSSFSGSNGSSYDSLLYRKGVRSKSKDFYPTPPKYQPINTSTPKKSASSPNYSSSTFWSDFYKRTGPKHISKPDLETDQRHSLMHQQWRPFLPKTHNYLCHQQNSYTPAAAWSRGPLLQKSYNPTQRCHHQLPFTQQVMPPPVGIRRQRLMGSLSSDGSSTNEGSLPDHCFHRTISQESPPICSCQDLSESSLPYWDTSLETECCNNEYFCTHNRRII